MNFNERAIMPDYQLNQLNVLICNAWKESILDCKFLRSNDWDITALSKPCFLPKIKGLVNPVF